MHLSTRLAVAALIVATVAALVAVTAARHLDDGRLASVDRLPDALKHAAEMETRIRAKRSIGDFFTKIWTIGSLGKAQYDDTRTSLAKVYEILRDTFSDTFVRKTVIG